MTLFSCFFLWSCDDENPEYLEELLFGIGEIDTTYVQPGLSLVFQDDFSGSFDWSTTTYGDFSIINGQLRISGGGDDQYQHYAYKYVDDMAEYSYVIPELEYSVDVDFYSGTSGTPYGIGLNDQYDNRYYFLITSYGEYKLAIWNTTDSWVDLIGYTDHTSTANAEGDGQLKLTYDDYEFKLYFDGEHLDSYSVLDKKFDRIYLYQQSEYLTVYFDNVKLYGTLSN